MEENKVPKEVLDITAEFIKIAKKHNLFDFNLEFRLQKGDTLKIQSLGIGEDTGIIVIMQVFFPK